MKNLLEDIPAATAEEQVKELLRLPHVRVERIVSQGHCSPEGFWYDQAETEWVLLLSGAAQLEFDDGTTRDLKAGDFVLIEPHVRHRVAWTSDEPAIWLALFIEPSNCDTA